MKSILCTTLPLFVLLVISLVLAEDQRLKGPPRAFLVSSDRGKVKSNCPDDMLSTILLKSYDAGLFFLASIERILTSANLSQPFPDAISDNCTYDTMDDFVRSIGYAWDSSLSSIERFVILDSKKPDNETGRDRNETLDSFLKNITHASDLMSKALKRAANEPEPTAVENNKTQKCSSDPLDTVARYILNATDTIGKFVKQVQADGSAERAGGKSKNGHSKGCPVDYLEQVVRIFMRSKFLISRAYDRAMGVGDVTKTMRESNCTVDSLDAVVDLFVKTRNHVDQAIARITPKAGTNDKAVEKQGNMCSHNVSNEIVRTLKLFREYLKVSIFRSKYTQFFSKKFHVQGTVSCDNDSLDELVGLTIDAMNLYDKALKRVERSVYLMITFPFKTLIGLTRNILVGICRVQNIFEAIKAVPVSTLENLLQKQDHHGYFPTRDKDICSNDSVTDYLSFMAKARDVILDLNLNGSKNSSLESMRSLPLDTVMGYVIYGAKLYGKYAEEIQSQLNPDRQMLKFVKMLNIPRRWKWMIEKNDINELFGQKDPLSYICHPRFSLMNYLERPRRDTLVVH